MQNVLEIGIVISNPVKLRELIFLTMNLHHEKQFQILLMKLVKKY